MQIHPIENPPPFALASAVEAFRMLELQQALSFAVAGLLLEVGSGSLSPMVPHNGAGCKGNPMPGLLQSPANVDIVSRFAKLRIKALDLLEGIAAKSHVTAGNVLRLLIAFQHMGRLAWTGCNTGGKAAVVGREVRSADCCSIGALQLVNKECEPIGIGEAVGIRVGDDLPCGCLQSDVSRNAQSLVGLTDSANAREPVENRRRIVCRSIIDNDHFKIRIG